MRPYEAGLVPVWSRRPGPQGNANLPLGDFGTCWKCGCAEAWRSKPTGGCCPTRSSGAARAGSSSPSWSANATERCAGRSSPSCCGRSRCPTPGRRRSARWSRACAGCSPRPASTARRRWPRPRAPTSWCCRPTRPSTSSSSRRRSRRPRPAADAGDVERGATGSRRPPSDIAARGFLTDDCEWVDQWRDAVRDLRVRAALARSAAHLAAGSSGRAVDAARDALALDPSREAAYRQLMRALAAAGERGEALRVWERCRITLVEELGVDPRPRPRPCTSRSSARRAGARGRCSRCRRASSRSCSPTSSSRRRCGRNTPRPWRRRSNGTTRSSARSSPRTAARC